MVIVSPPRIGLWDPFQMAFSWLIIRGDPNHLLLGWSSKHPPNKTKLHISNKAGGNAYIIDAPPDLLNKSLKRLIKHYNPRENMYNVDPGLINPMVVLMGGGSHFKGDLSLLGVPPFIITIGVYSSGIDIICVWISSTHLHLHHLYCSKNSQL